MKGCRDNKTAWSMCMRPFVFAGIFVFLYEKMISDVILARHNRTKGLNPPCNVAFMKYSMIEYIVFNNLLCFRLLTLFSIKKTSAAIFTCFIVQQC